MIYFHKTSLTASAGSTRTLTLDVHPGLCRQFLVESTGASTVFRANLVDKDGYTIMNYGFHTNQINDVSFFPMDGRYTVNITNASADDLFNVVVGVEEVR